MSAPAEKLTAFALMPLAALIFDPPGASGASGGCAAALFYWPGPETVKLTELDSFLPSPVQMAPSASQSVVPGVRWSRPRCPAALP